MDAQYTEWTRHWQAALDACRRKGGEAKELITAPPASEKAVAEVEEKIGHALPSSFRQIVVTFSADVAMSWLLPEDCQPPETFDKLLAGECTWGLSSMVSLAEGYQLWIDALRDVDDPDDDLIWHNKLAFAEVGNGDLIAFDLNATPDPSVVYLNHECGDTSGWRLGDNFIDFISRYSSLGCPGYDDVLMMPFLPDATSGLDAYCENARKWREWFGLDFEVNP